VFLLGAIFDREEIVSFSLFKEATPKKGFSQQILGFRAVGLRVMASRLGVNPWGKPPHEKEDFLLAKYPASP
jgi:hypothetical protein